MRAWCKSGFLSGKPYAAAVQIPSVSGKKNFALNCMIQF